MSERQRESYLRRYMRLRANHYSDSTSASDGAQAPASSSTATAAAAIGAAASGSGASATSHCATLASLIASKASFASEESQSALDMLIHAGAGTTSTDDSTRMIVLSYLIHNCYPDSARAFMAGLGIDYNSIDESYSAIADAAAATNASIHEPTPAPAPAGDTGNLLLHTGNDDASAAGLVTHRSTHSTHVNDPNDSSMDVVHENDSLPSSASESTANTSTSLSTSASSSSASRPTPLFEAAMAAAKAASVSSSSPQESQPLTSMDELGNNNDGSSVELAGSKADDKGDDAGTRTVGISKRVYSLDSPGEDAANKARVKWAVAHRSGFQSMQFRKEVFENIIAGNLEKALADCKRSYPDMLNFGEKLPSSPELVRVLFLLKSQMYLECVRIGNTKQALSLLQNELAKFAFVETSTYLDQLQDLAPLLAYNNPATSPVGHLLNPDRRHLVASALNSLILGYLKSPMYDSLGNIVKQLTVTRELLSKERGLNIKPFKLSEFVQEKAPTTPRSSSRSETR